MVVKGNGVGDIGCNRALGLCVAGTVYRNGVAAVVALGYGILHADGQVGNGPAFVVLQGKDCAAVFKGHTPIGAREDVSVKSCGHGKGKRLRAVRSAAGNRLGYDQAAIFGSRGIFVQVVIKGDRGGDIGCDRALGLSVYRNGVVAIVALGHGICCAGRQVGSGLIFTVLQGKDCAAVFKGHIPIGTCEGISVKSCGHGKGKRLRFVRSAAGNRLGYGQAAIFGSRGIFVQVVVKGDGGGDIGCDRALGLSGYRNGVVAVVALGHGIFHADGQVRCGLAFTVLQGKDCAAVFKGHIPIGTCEGISVKSCGHGKGKRLRFVRSAAGNRLGYGQATIFGSSNGSIGVIHHKGKGLSGFADRKDHAISILSVYGKAGDKVIPVNTGIFFYHDITAGFKILGEVESVAVGRQFYIVTQKCASLRFSIPIHLENVDLGVRIGNALLCAAGSLFDVDRSCICQLCIGKLCDGNCVVILCDNNVILAVIGGRFAVNVANGIACLLRFRDGIRTRFEIGKGDGFAAFYRYGVVIVDPVVSGYFESKGCFILNFLSVFVNNNLFNGEFAFGDISARALSCDIQVQAGGGSLSPLASHAIAAGTLLHAGILHILDIGIVIGLTAYFGGRQDVFQNIRDSLKKYTAAYPNIGHFISAKLPRNGVRIDVLPNLIFPFAALAFRPNMMLAEIIDGFANLYLDAV